MRADAEEAAIIMPALVRMGLMHEPGIAVVFVEELDHAADGQIAFFSGDKLALVAVTIAVPVGAFFVDLKVTFAVIAAT
jgi:hypothetical protein